MTYIVNPNDPSSPTDVQGAKQGAEELRALKARIAAIIAGGLIVSADAANPADFISGIFPNTETTHRDMIRAGFTPAFFNQQWGGAPHWFEMVDSATGTPYKFESATGYIATNGNNTYTAIGYDNTNYSEAQGFKVSKDVSVSAIWVRLQKSGNPTDNLEFRIQADDGSGKPTANFTAITNGTANNLDCRLINANYSWIRITFATPCALTAGTQYHLTAKRSGANSTANFIRWDSTTSGTYPHGTECLGTNVPAWTAASGADHLFMLEASSITESIQSGGAFGRGYLQPFEGTPLNQSAGWCRDIKAISGFSFGNGVTLSHVWTNLTKDKTFWEMGYGVDHDRVVLRCMAGTGYAQVTVYNTDGTSISVTGITDISSGTHDVGFYIRAAGDGGDVLALLVDGVEQGSTLTSQTIVFDELFKLGQVGTEWLGGGFALAPTWSGSSISSFTGLPSTLGWTWTGTGTEVNCMSASGNRLYQNKNGYTANQTGYYEKSAAGLSNANGWSIVAKHKLMSAANTKGEEASCIQVFDGTKRASILINEYYYSSTQLASVAYPQVDLKTVSAIHHIGGKGNDALYFANGKLLVDGTGLMTSATASNLIDFGDMSAAANENADALWEYLKYYSPSALLPQFTSGQLSEYRLFSGDKRTLLTTLYGSGTRISAKAYCGVRENWVGNDSPMCITLNGITNQPTSTATSYISNPIPETDGYIIGSCVTALVSGNTSNNTPGQTNFVVPIIDDEYTIQSVTGTGGVSSGYETAAGGRIPFAITDVKPNRYFGLHRFESRIVMTGGTATIFARTTKVEAKS